MKDPEPAAERRAADAKAQPEEPMLYCPVCATRLTERKCKLICEKCGYYLSCADYY
jgi:methionyl-tRNA synthetase